MANPMHLLLTSYFLFFVSLFNISPCTPTSSTEANDQVPCMMCNECQNPCQPPPLPPPPPVIECPPPPAPPPPPPPVAECPPPPKPPPCTVCEPVPPACSGNCESEKPPSLMPDPPLPPMPWLPPAPPRPPYMPGTNYPPYVTPGTLYPFEEPFQEKDNGGTVKPFPVSVYFTLQCLISLAVLSLHCYRFV